MLSVTRLGHATSSNLNYQLTMGSMLTITESVAEDKYIINSTVKEDVELKIHICEY